MEETLYDKQIKKINWIPVIIALITMLMIIGVLVRIIYGYSYDPYKKTKFSESDREIISSVFNLENNSFELDTMTYITKEKPETYNLFVKTSDIEQFSETYGLKKQNYYSVSEEYPYSRDSNICCTVYAWDEESYTLWFQFKGHNDKLSSLFDKK